MTDRTPTSRVRKLFTRTLFATLGTALVAGSLALAQPASAAPAVQPDGELTIVLQTKDIALGEQSQLPVLAFSPHLPSGQVIDLDWELDPARGGAPITTGSADYVQGEPYPLVGVPATVAGPEVVLTVHASTDSDEWGHLEGESSAAYQVDTDAPPVLLNVSDDVIFPARDSYRDYVTMGIRSADDVDSLKVDLVSKAGSARRIYTQPGGYLYNLRFDGTVKGEQARAGQYTVRVTATDRAGNSAVAERPLKVDDRRAVRKTYRTTIPAAQTVVDKYVGACSHLGAANGRGWKGSLGLYSSPCAKKNGSTVITVHSAKLPASVLGYNGDVTVTTYGAAARGTDSAYIVRGWLRAKDNKFLRPETYVSSGLDSRTATARAGEVVRTIHGHSSVSWEMGLAAGSRYDLKSFTVSAYYYELV